jgi:hypothetical protein
LNRTCSVACSPGFSVTGKLLPETVKPVPVTPTELTVTGALPVEVNVAFCVTGLPIVTEPKLKAPGVTESCGVELATPFAASATAAAPSRELLVKDISPLMEPVAAGLNCTGSEICWFGLRVIGKIESSIEKPAPTRVAEVTLTAAVPLESSVTAWVVGLPTVTSPKLSAAAETVRRGSPGTGAAFAPDPARATVVTGEEVELLLTVIWPVALPAPVGTNRTCKSSLLPGAKLTGNEAPTIENSAPEMGTEFTTTAAVPVELSVKVRVPVEDNATEPKSRLPEVTESCGLVVLLAEPLPERSRNKFLFVVELLSISIFPLALPPLFGANTAWRVTDEFRAIDIGKMPPVTVKPDPVTLSADTVSVVEPVFLRVRSFDDLPPTATGSSARLAGVTESICVPLPRAFVAAPLSWSPQQVVAATDTNAKMANRAVKKTCALDVILCVADRSGESLMLKDLHCRTVRELSFR